MTRRYKRLPPNIKSIPIRSAPGRNRRLRAWRMCFRAAGVLLVPARPRSRSCMPRSGGLRLKMIFVSRAQKMSLADKKEMIRPDHRQLSITQQCRIVGLSRSSFYYAPVGVNAATLDLIKAIDRVFTQQKPHRHNPNQTPTVVQIVLHFSFPEIAIAPLPANPRQPNYQRMGVGRTR